MQVAQTILAQLGGSRFVAMTGARNLLASDDGLSFKVGRNGSGVTHVRVRLTGADLYDVDYLAVRGARVRVVAQDADLYADQLPAMFTMATGLATHI